MSLNFMTFPPKSAQRNIRKSQIVECGRRSMAKRKNSEVEMIGVFKQMEAGRSAAEVGRELTAPSGLSLLTVGCGVPPLAACLDT